MTSSEQTQSKPQKTSAKTLDYQYLVEIVNQVAKIMCDERLDHVKIGEVEIRKSYHKAYLEQSQPVPSTARDEKKEAFVDEELLFWSAGGDSKAVL